MATCNGHLWIYSAQQLQASLYEFTLIESMSHILRSL